MRIGGGVDQHGFDAVAAVFDPDREGGSAEHGALAGEVVAEQLEEAGREGGDPAGERFDQGCVDGPEGQEAEGSREEGAEDGEKP